MMIDATELYILIWIYVILTLIQGYRYVRKQEDLHHFLMG